MVWLSSKFFGTPQTYLEWFRMVSRVGAHKSTFDWIRPPYHWVLWKHEDIFTLGAMIQTEIGSNCTYIVHNEPFTLVYLKLFNFSHLLSSDNKSIFVVKSAVVNLDKEVTLSRLRLDSWGWRKFCPWQCLQSCWSLTPCYQNREGRAQPWW